MRFPRRLGRPVVALAACLAVFVAAPAFAASGPEPFAKWFSSSQGIPQPAVRALALDPSDPARMVAETDYGTFRSIDSGASWTKIQGTENCGTYGVDVEIAPYDSNRIYIADYCEGVVATADGGVTWTVQNSGLPGSENLDAIAIAPTAPYTMYLGAAFRDQPFYGGGVYRSDDAGESWTASGLQNLLVFDIAFHPQSSAILFAGTNKGVRKSVDGGAHWTTSVTDVPIDVKSIAFDPRDPNVMYAGTWGKNVWKSVDGGKNWGATGGGWQSGDGGEGVYHVAVNSFPPYEVFAATTQGVYVSRNAGGEWVDLGAPGVQFSALIVRGRPVSPVIYAGTQAGAFGGLYKGLLLSRRAYLPLATR